MVGVCFAFWRDLLFSGFSLSLFVLWFGGCARGDGECLCCGYVNVRLVFWVVDLSVFWGWLFCLGRHSETSTYIVSRWPQVTFLAHE